ncbi:partitioning protein (plasmid) [Pseudomonas frederiksbergensis]|uniref:Partitioning protein n=1 Tax=Pseudomonas frederiksbergensis TaxID=104087 RepID=A0A1J0EUJ2_9PSED|nr:partitioning protein [Pseudomonas frederiksbergensis]
MKRTVVLVIANHKGGAAKTTTGINLGDNIAQMGKSVCLLDMDPQANASRHIGLSHPSEIQYTAAEMLSIVELPLALFIHDETRVEGVSLIYGSIGLENSDDLLRAEPRPNEVLKERLAPLMGTADFIIIDCPPSLKLLTTNALAAGTHLIVPVESGDAYGLHGHEDLLSRVKKIKQINPELINLGVLLNRHDQRQVVCKNMEENAASLYGTVVPVKLGTTTKVKQASSLQMTLRQLDSGNTVSQQFRQLAEWLVEETREFRGEA